MNQYRKLIMAVAGVVALMLERHVGVDVGEDTQMMVTDLVVSVLTALGVWGSPNDSE